MQTHSLMSLQMENLKINPANNFQEPYNKDS